MGRLTEELEAVRQYGRVTANTFVASSSSSSTSFTDANNAAANNIAIITRNPRQNGYVIINMTKIHDVLRYMHYVI